ncbi:MULTISPECIES: tetratricopeptide repeat protein [unclassified Chryseobacterium]|uniref:tetratricopeptide repeat protein n=1 Tax=unclassified Chryseobacterium TaxID=2593645 RepID=UPI003018EF2B
MRKLILGIAIVASAFVFGQKEDVNAKLQEANKVAMDAYNAKNYAAAAPKFMEVYNLLKTNGQDNKVYMYYSGLNYALANDIPQATKIYTDLINSGYTGVETTYTAKDNKTGQVASYDKNTWELLKKTSSKDYSDFKTEQSSSVEQDLYETLATLLINAKKNDEALALIEKGLAKFPNSAKLKEYQGSALYASGNTEKFMTNLKEQLAKNPNDATNWYNLGVLQAKNPATTAEAIASFQKAIELKPDFANAYQNLVYTVIGDDEKAVSEINALRKTKPDDATKLIEARKERFNKAIPYGEKWLQAMPTDLTAVQIMKDVYNTAKNTAKYNEMKAKEAELAAKQPAK